MSASQGGSMSSHGISPPVPPITSLIMLNARVMLSAILLMTGVAAWMPETREGMMRAANCDKPPMKLVMMGNTATPIWSRKFFIWTAKAAICAWADWLTSSMPP